jgi:hypothetical protein
MDQRDQELLGKQLRQLNPSPRSDSVMMLAILAVFFAGMARRLLLLRAAANRVERRNDRNFRSERCAANDFALIVPFGSYF